MKNKKDVLFSLYKRESVILNPTNHSDVENNLFLLCSIENYKGLVTGILGFELKECAKQKFKNCLMSIGVINEGVFKSHFCVA
ncbi:hypothetical protein EFP95_06760 [Lentilactobacillus hilgardii]|nr:hypothetical protein [Lentilactobacillus hilgardii]